MIAWIISNVATLSEIFSGLVAVSTLIAGLTPTKKDDGAVATLVKVADQFSIWHTKKDAAILKEAKEK